MTPKPITKNTLFYGDNWTILQEHFPTESVDLIYLDPPFNSNRSYNVLFKDESGHGAESQIEVFGDTWHWGSVAEETHEWLTCKVDNYDVRKVIKALRDFLGENQMMAYVVMMAARLVELHRVLKPTGSLYLHCDPTASHYLKITLDAVFGPVYFRNEIVWKRTTTHSDAKRWSPVSDSILYYVKSNTFTWNPQFAVHDAAYVADKYRYDDNDGRGPYTLDNMTSPNPRPNMMYEWHGHASPQFGWRYSKETMQKLDAEARIWYPASKDKRPRLKRYLNEMPGRILDNVWLDISPINSQAQERLGYPTQKPLALLERIILASSNPGDVVLDPFCGCGTAVAAAQKLGRKWIGVDITHLAIALMRYRLDSSFPGIKYDVIGEPEDLAGARQLAKENQYQFQWWVCSLVKAMPFGAQGGSKTGKKGKDEGVDGIITFIDDSTGKPKQVIVQVKSGHVGSPAVVQLVGSLEQHEAAMGVFITLEPPTQDMITAAAKAGKYHSPGWNKDYKKVQIFTVEQLLNGAKVDMPPTDITFKQAQKVQELVGQDQLGLNL